MYADSAQRRKTEIMPIARFMTILIGLLEGLLIARFVLRLFAARPDNVVVQAVYFVTQPFIAPLSWLDAMQPRYGAALEFATFATLLLVPLLFALVWRLKGSSQAGNQA